MLNANIEISRKVKKKAIYNTAAKRYHFGVFLVFFYVGCNLLLNNIMAHTSLTG